MNQVSIPQLKINKIIQCVFVNNVISISFNMCFFSAQKNRLIETVLLSTHNTCFGCDIRKIFFLNLSSLRGLVYRRHMILFINPYKPNVTLWNIDKQFRHRLDEPGSPLFAYCMFC